MEKQHYLIPISILVAAIIISCAIVYDHEDETDNGLSAEQMVASSLFIGVWDDGGWTFGTGFVIEQDGIYVITNAHVLLDDGILGDVIIGKFYDSDQEYPLSVVEYDASLDLAVLKFDDVPDVVPLEIISNSGVEYGQEVCAVGNPNGIGLSFAKGVVSNISIDIDAYEKMIQTNMGASPGCSGGPLLDMSGKVIGVISMKLGSQGTNIEDVSFAIPSDILIEYLDSVL